MADNLPELRRCIAAGYEAIMAFLHKEYVGDRFEIALREDSLGAFWEVYDAETGTFPLSNRAPASIWETDDGSWMMVSDKILIDQVAR